MPDQLILGSKSPRRRQIMKDAGYSFEVMVSEGEERVHPDWELADVPEALALQKASEIVRQIDRPDYVLITCDTIVLLGDQIIGKPENKAHAMETLQRLSGHTHTVISGVCVASPAGHQTFSSHTEVVFRTLTVEEIQFYVHHFEVMDKAGAYAIQEWIGMIGIEEIRGSYYNVMGLPIDKVYRALNGLGITPVRT